MEPSVDPQLALNSAPCVTDLSCVFGQECASGACAPIEPSLYPHIQTALVLLRTPFGDETEWAATHYDLMIGAIRPDEQRPLNPTMRFFDYTPTRYHRFDEGEKTASEWAVAHGYDPEDFFLHYREDVYVPTWEGRVIVPGYPAGMVPGWNPGGGGPPATATNRSQSRVVGFYAGSPTASWFANVAHPGFRQFLLQRLIGLVDGTWYYNQPYDTGPLEGVLCDEAVYYPSFGEGLLDKSQEYYGVPINDNHPYAVSIEGLYPYLSGMLMTALGITVDVMPNYGHVLFLNYPNRSAQNIQQTTPWILGEVWVTYTGTSTPTGGGNRCITYDKDYANGVREIVRQTRRGGRRVLGARDTSNGIAGSDRGKMFTLALYYLLHNDHTYYAYESVESGADHISTWTWNSAVTYDIGQPLPIPAGTVDFEGRSNTNEHWVMATGPDPYAPNLTYRVLARRFSNALVLVKMLPLGSVEDNRSMTIHPLDMNYRVLEPNGTLGPSGNQLRIRNNEAFILIPDISTGVDY